MKLGIRGHDFGKKGEFSLTEKLMDFGFDGVQLVPYKTFDYVPYNPTISDETAAEISNSLANIKKEVFLIGAYFNPVHSDKTKVENGIETFKRYLELAKTFKTTVVGSETGSFNDDKWTYNPKNRTEEALQTVIDTFSDLCKFAKSKGVYVGMEGAAGHVCYAPSILKKAVDSINSENLKVIFDLYNYLDDNNYNDYMSILDEGLETFGNKIHCFHMKDCEIVDGKLKQCPIGKGIFDYKTILEKIKKHNNDALLILEGTTGENILPAVEIIKNNWF